MLLEALLAMRRILQQITNGYDVLLEAVTIAGLSLRVFKKLFLKPDKLAIVPNGGYQKFDRASDKAICYIEWRSKEIGKCIQHAGNGREKMFDIDGHRYRVDGWLEDERRIFEFLGCYYHGCPECTDPDEVGPNGNLNRINYQRTMNRLDQLRETGNNVVEFGK